MYAVCWSYDHSLFLLSVRIYGHRGHNCMSTYEKLNCYHTTYVSRIMFTKQEYVATTNILANEQRTSRDQRKIPVLSMSIEKSSRAGRKDIPKKLLRNEIVPNCGGYLIQIQKVRRLLMDIMYQSDVGQQVQTICSRATKGELLKKSYV